MQDNTGDQLSPVEKIVIKTEGHDPNTMSKSMKNIDVVECNDPILQSLLLCISRDSECYTADEAVHRLWEMFQKIPRVCEALEKEDSPFFAKLKNAYRKVAIEHNHDPGTLEIENDAVVSMNESTETHDGAYVQSWVWVDSSEVASVEDEYVLQA